jgi:hypothetical protein
MIFSCPNANKPDKGMRGTLYVKRWADVYLKKARKRLQGQISGFEFTIEELYSMQLMCAYEVCASHVCMPTFNHYTDRRYWLFQVL